MKTPVKRPIGKTEYELLSSFRYALRHFLRFSEAAALELGLTAQQHQVLLAIKGFPHREEISVGELAERLQIRHHSAVGLADRLLAEGLLIRRPGHEDRRQVFLGLSAKGEEVLTRLSEVHREELRQIGPELMKLLGQLSS